MNTVQTLDHPSAGPAQSSPAQSSLARHILQEIWSTTLGHEVASTENFFEAGGDSLKALATIEQINQRLGWRLNLGDLLRFQTIDALDAARAQPQVANTEQALIRMSDRGTGTPIVFIHAGGGLVDGYGPLVRELGQDRACYGLQSPQLLRDDAVLPDSIPGLAALYAELLQDELGDEAFHLFGSCGSGAICLELGRIAADHGLTVAKIVVVDGYLELDSPGPVAESELLADFYDAVRGMSRLTGEYPAISSTDADLDQVLRSSAVAMFGTDRGLTEAAEAFCRRIYRVFLNMTQTLESYRPEPAEVDLLILLAKDNQTLEQWRSVVAGELTAEVLESDLYGHQLCIQEAPSLAARTLDYLGEQ